MNKRDMKIQKILLLAILAGMASTANAQFQKSILKEFQQNSKFGGYIIGKYDYNDKASTFVWAVCMSTGRFRISTTNFRLR